MTVVDDSCRYKRGVIYGGPMEREKQRRRGGNLGDSGIEGSGRKGREWNGGW